jgi:hypothetical protein
VRRLRRRLSLPVGWSSIRGLWIATDGLYGAVLNEPDQRIALFEGVHVISVDVVGWTVAEIIGCLTSHDTPPNVEPRVALLTEAHLEPLIGCGALTRINALGLMAHVPGWQP